MKLTCDRSKLVASLEVAAAATSVRGNKPILKNAKLTATEQGTTLAATDTEFWVLADVEGVTIEEPGAVLLPASQLLASLKRDACETVIIETKDDHVHIKCERSEFKLNTEDPAEFPSVGSERLPGGVELSAVGFVECLKRAACGMGDDEKQYVLNGVHLEVHKGSLFAVGTTGRMIATQLVKAGLGDEVQISPLTIPAAAVQRIIRVFGGHGPVTVAANDSSIHIYGEGLTAGASLSEGRFPEWQKNIPDSANPPVHTFQQSIGPLLVAVQQVGVLADTDKGYAGAITLTAATGEIKLIAKNERGRGESTVLNAYSGEEVDARINLSYLMRTLAILPNESIVDFGIVIHNGEDAANRPTKAGTLKLQTDDGFWAVIAGMAVTVETTE